MVSPPTSSWLATVGANPRGRAREHASFLTAGALDGTKAQIRDVVAQSWRRSSAAYVDPDTDPPVTLVDQDLAAYPG